MENNDNTNQQELNNNTRPIAITIICIIGFISVFFSLSTLLSITESIVREEIKLQ
jgi:hypothetical protein